LSQLRQPTLVEAARTGKAKTIAENSTLIGVNDADYMPLFAGRPFF
jgi:hypothetical protein